TVEGYEHYLAAQAEGRGVIFASVHVGPAEIPLQALGARGFRYTAVVEQVRPRQVAELLQRVREAHGGRYVYPTLAGTRELLRTRFEPFVRRYAEEWIVLQQLWM